MFNVLSKQVVLAVMGIAALSSCVTAGEMINEPRVFTGANGSTLPYRLVIPAGYDASKVYPLVLCLHGAGGRGIDNQGKGCQAFTTLSSAEVQAEYPAVLLMPQCPTGAQWVDTPWSDGSYSLDKIAISQPMRLVLEILDSAQKEFSIDPARIYISGQSMGGYGSWDFILREPNRFAAAAIVCGAGDPSKAERIAGLPIWVFHGDADPTVPVSGSRDMVAALKAVGGNVKYTEYPGVEHKSWGRAWKEKDLVPWLFSQKKVD